MIVSDNELGDIFDSEAQAIVVPVNTHGAMGAGLARQAKQRVPGLYEAYRDACKQRVFSQKGYFVYHDFDSADEVRTYICLPTKRDWREPSKLIWIDEALSRIAQYYYKDGLTSIAFPALGCGLGELDWGDVEPLIRAHFEHHPVRVYLYPPKKQKKKEAAY